MEKRRTLLALGLALTAMLLTSALLAAPPTEAKVTLTVNGMT